MSPPTLPDQAPPFGATQVIVADGHELMRAGLRMIIDQAPDLTVIAEAATGEEVLMLAGRTRAHVVLLEVALPGMSGIEVMAHLSADPTNATRAVILTTFDHDELVRESFRAGARGYLIKTAPPTMVLDAIRAAASPRGGTMLSPEITQRLVQQTMRVPRPATNADVDLSMLSDAEMRVLDAVAQGLNNAEVAARLSVSEATVKSHMSAILRKLGVRDRVQCVIAAYRAGLVTPGE